MMTQSEFGTLLAGLVTTYGGNKQDLARAIGISPSTLSRLLDGRPPSTELCLRLATTTHTNASRILRAAGKGAIADLIEDLYGTAAHRQLFRGFPLTPLEQRRTTIVRNLSRDKLRALDQFIGWVASATVTAPLDHVRVINEAP